MEKQTIKKEEKCTKCDKMKRRIAPQVIVGVLVFVFSIYGLVEFVKEIISFFTN